MTRDHKAYLFAGLTVVAWSTVASAFKLSLRELSPGELLLYASLTSTLVLSVVTTSQRGWGRLHEWRLRDYFASLGLGLLNPFLYYLLLFGAYDRLPAQEAQPLNYSWPVVLVLLSRVFLGQRISPAVVAAMLMSLVGVAVISTRGDLLALRFTDRTGVLLALASTVIWASYWLLNLRDRREPVVRLWVSFVFGSAAIVIYMLVFESLRVPGLWGLAGAAYAGCFEMGLTFVWWLSALGYARNTAQVSGLIFLSPFLSLVFIHLVVGERIYPATLAGLILIIAGTIAQQRIRARTALAVDSAARP